MTYKHTNMRDASPYYCVGWEWAESEERHNRYGLSEAGAKVGMSGFKDACARKRFVFFFLFLLLVASNSIQERMRGG